MKKYWFKPRKFGLGFTPVTWEGWVTVLVMLVVIGVSAFKNNLFDEKIFQARDGWEFLIEIFLTIAIFHLFSEPKTDGKTKWRWGGEGK